MKKRKTIKIKKSTTLFGQKPEIKSTRGKKVVTKEREEPKGIKQMKDINLGDKCRIRSTEYCYVLEVLNEPENKEKQPYWSTEGNYGRIEHALKGFLDMNLKSKDQDLKTIVKDSLKVIEDAHLQIEGLTTFKISI